MKFCSSNFLDADLFQQVRMMPADERWLHIQQTVQYVKTKQYAETVKEKEKSGIRKLAAKFKLEGESWQFMLTIIPSQFTALPSNSLSS